MFGLTTRGKPSQPPAVPDRAQVVGLDLTATRVRGVALAAGRTRTLLLDEPAEDLPLFLSLDRRVPEAGRAGFAACRKAPHLVCSNFLASLGRPREWRSGRTAVTPETALAAVLDRLHRPVAAETDAVVLALPAYLSAAQARGVVELATRSKLPLRGTISTPLAVAAHRASWLLGEDQKAPPADGQGRPDWLVPMRGPGHGPAAVVVVDADEFALSASVVGAEPTEVKLIASAAWERASLKLWKDRLVDAISDRCVRLCRRDPRDSGEAEQLLFEQLDPALERARHGHSVLVSVRGQHWYQDIAHQPEDFDAYCAPLARLVADGVRELLRGANLPVPPRSVWLTHAAARLPGLAGAVYHATPEQTDVLALPANAVADAAAALVPRWLTGQLPRLHLDAFIPLEARTPPQQAQGQNANRLPPTRVKGR